MAGGCLTGLKYNYLIRRVPIAALADLTLSEEAAWVDHVLGKYLDALDYVLRRMPGGGGLSVRGLREEEKKILDRVTVMVKLPPSRRGDVCLG